MNEVSPALTGHAVNDHEGAVGDPEGGSDLRGEVNVAGGVDEVDEEALAVLLALLLDEGQVGVGHLEVHGDGGGLDGDAPLLLVLPGVRGPAGGN